MNSEERAHVPMNKGPLAGVVQYTPKDLGRAMAADVDLRTLDPMRLLASNTIQAAALAHARGPVSWSDCGCAECGRMAVWFDNADALLGTTNTVVDLIRRIGRN